MIEVAPFSVAMTMVSRTVFEPTANFSNSNTPTGPFQTMVAARSMTVEKVAMDFSPTSRPIQPSGMPVSRVALPTYKEEEEGERVSAGAWGGRTSEI